METARPVTPPPYIIPAIVNERLDDMQRLLGQLVGQNRDLMDEVARRRSFEVELPSGPQKRMEDMMRRILRKLGYEPIEDYPPVFEGSPPPSPPPGTACTKEGSMYGGTDTVFSEEYAQKNRAPAPSFTSSYDQRKQFSGVPDSLLDGSIGDPDFDDEYAMQDLPPQDPPTEHVIPRVQVPPHLTKHRRQQSAATTPMAVPSSIPEEPEPAPERTHQAYAETEPESPDLPPLPYRQEDESERDPSVYSEDYIQRQPAHRGPPPQPVDLPTPVNSVRNVPNQQYPQQMPQMQMPGRPPFGMMPPPPGASNLPRPSLPRIAGVRDPISTT